MNKPIYIVDYFKDIVSAVSAKLLSELKAHDNVITGVHYQHGHPREIIETLTQMTDGIASRFDKYPLIALFQDFPEDVTGNGFYADVTLHFIIARGTEATYKADQRYDKNFKPILYPVYFEFMEQIRLSKKFEIVSAANTYPHKKIDRLYWGREGLYGGEGNTFNDRLDCIEIKDLKLRVKTQNC